MKTKKTIITIALIALLAIISIQYSTMSKMTENTDNLIPNASTIETPDGYIGLTPEQATQLAEQNGDMFRIVSIDGEPRPTTRDYRFGRVNASVVDGLVSEYSIEGE